jgi:DNA-damage-inducible protein J
MSKATTTFSMRIDPDLKKNAADLFDSMGIDMSAAINMFLTQSVKEKKLPFQPTLAFEPDEDLKQLLFEINKGHQDVLAGRTIPIEEVYRKFGGQIDED